MTPRLSAIVECPSPSPSQVPACPDPPVVKALHHDPAGTQTHPYSLCDDKEIDVTSEIVKVPNQKNDISSIDKEVAITNGTGFQKVCKDSLFKYRGCQLDIPDLMGSCSQSAGHEYDRRGSQCRKS